MKLCSRCNTPVSDEYKYCLNCGNVLDDSSAVVEEPLPTLVYHTPIATPPTVPPTIGPDAPSSLSNNSSGRSSHLPWLIVGACIVTIVALVAIIAIQRRAAVTETLTTAPTNEVISTPTPTPASSEAVLVPNTNQPTPVSSVSPQAGKEPTPTRTATPVASANVDNPQSQRSPSPRPINDSSLTPPAPRDEPPGNPNRVYSNREVSEPARIVSKPQPSYSEEARQNQVQGVVVLRVILSSDGTIVGISVLSGLPHGLTERAIAAARQIKFTPAQKDGVPVTVAMHVEYKFNLY